jgi:hypothetical protein
MKFTQHILIPMLLAVASSQGATITYTGSLSGANENPVVVTPATGFASASYDNIAHTLTLDASFSGLVGLTTASHIHCCTAPPGNAGWQPPRQVSSDSRLA